MKAQLLSGGVFFHVAFSVLSEKDFMIGTVRLSAELKVETCHILVGPSTNGSNPPLIAVPDRLSLVL